MFSSEQDQDVKDLGGGSSQDFGCLEHLYLCMCCCPLDTLRFLATTNLKGHGGRYISS